MASASLGPEHKNEHVFSVAFTLVWRKSSTAVCLPPSRSSGSVEVKHVRLPRRQVETTFYLFFLTILPALPSNSLTTS